MEDSEISIGIHLSRNNFEKDELEKFSRLKKWLGNIKLDKLLIAIPNATENTKKLFEELFGGEDRIKLIFKKGKEDFVKKVSDLLEEVREGELELIDIDEELVREKMGFLKGLDIIIKFGDKRLPNNFIWEKSYSELFFLDKISDFDEKSFLDIIEEFKERDRRFGA